MLRNALPALLPAAWLSEETADDGERLKHSRVWVVDPLDGTKEFIAGIPEYAIAVGLVDAGEPVLAVIHNPANGELYSALRGGGAWMNGKPMKTAERNVLLASRSETKGGEFAPFVSEGVEVREMGSIAYKLALVAAGVAGATVSRGPKWEWDVCAGALLVHEAGGSATDMFGDALGFNKSFPKVKGILAGAPTMHGRMKTFLSGLGASTRMSEMDGKPGQ
jgi:myo-inositol-1(or 4)-monophosphatase